MPLKEYPSDEEEKGVKRKERGDVHPEARVRAPSPDRNGHRQPRESVTCGVQGLSLHGAQVCTQRQDTELLEPKGHGHRNEILRSDLCGPGSENQKRRPRWGLLQGPDGSQSPII